MAQESVIHRLDAELALDVPVAPIPEDLAVDGIDEVLKLFVGYGSHAWREDFQPVLSAPRAGRSSSRSTAVRPGWSARSPTASTSLTPARGLRRRGGATSRGCGAAVLRWLWAREAPGGSDAQAEGDEATLSDCANYWWPRRSSFRNRRRMESWRPIGAAGGWGRPGLEVAGWRVPRLADRRGWPTERRSAGASLCRAVAIGAARPEAADRVWSRLRWRGDGLTTTGAVRWRRGVPPARPERRGSASCLSRGLPLPPYGSDVGPNLGDSRSGCTWLAVGRAVFRADPGHRRGI